MIRLRRPVVISVQEGRFVPERGAASLDEINARWEALRASNPAYHDGPAYHVLGVHRNGHGGAAIHVIESSYRFQAVQREDFDVGHRGLGVRGLVRADSGAVLMGRRSVDVGRYPGMWEFLPAGGLELGETPEAGLDREMCEEIGLDDCRQAKQIAVMFDDAARTWEIVFEVDLPAARQVRSAGEHTEIRWFDVRKLPEPFSPITTMMCELLGV